MYEDANTIGTDVGALALAKHLELPLSLSCAFLRRPAPPGQKFILLDDYAPFREGEVVYWCVPYPIREQHYADLMEVHTRDKHTSGWVPEDLLREDVAAAAGVREPGPVRADEGRRVALRRFIAPTHAIYWAQVDVSTGAFIEDAGWYWECGVEWRRYQCPISLRYYRCEVTSQDRSFFPECRWHWDDDELR